MSLPVTQITQVMGRRTVYQPSRKSVHTPSLYEMGFKAARPEIAMAEQRRELACPQGPRTSKHRGRFYFCIYFILTKIIREVK